MHPNFFHWHSRAELKPDPAILEPRWNAAAKFAEKLASDDVRSLLRLVLFSGAEPDFAKRFMEALVKVEPTFPIANNAELLRVMAAASVQSRLEKPSDVADAIALGLHAATFPQGRSEPVCQDVMTSAMQYLAQESERRRPEIDPGVLEKAEKQVESQYVALKKAAEANNVPDMTKAIETVGRGVLGAMKASHERLGEVIGRLTEESQYLWWLIGRWSPNMKTRRDPLSAAEYALPAAAEAAARVSLLPPAASVEALLEEVLNQCGKRGEAKTSLLDLLLDGNHTQDDKTKATQELTPLATLLAERSQSSKPDVDSLKRLGFPPKATISPIEAARQYFRELVFIRAMADIS